MSVVYLFQTLFSLFFPPFFFSTYNGNFAGKHVQKRVALLLGTILLIRCNDNDSRPVVVLVETLRCTSQYIALFCHDTLLVCSNVTLSRWCHVVTLSRVTLSKTVRLDKAIHFGESF